MPVNNDALYNPRLVVKNFAEIFAGWTERSEAARGRGKVHLDVPYDAGPLERMDIFVPKGRSRGLLVFIHGGYWRMLDKKDHSFIAPAFVDADVTVAVVNYSLCPAVTIADIVMQMVQACAWLRRNGRHFGAPPDNLYVAGHSAGGHLTAMMLATLWPVYARDLPAKVVDGGFSISGVYDVSPIIHVPSVNADVRLTPALARKVSPAGMPPATDAPLWTAVGGEEQQGFHDQNRLIATRWKQVHAGDVPCPGENHFSILDRLSESGSVLNRAVLGMMGIR